MVRTYLAGQLAVQKEDVRLMKDDPDAWRRDVIPFTDEKTRADAVKKKKEEVSTFVSTFTETNTLHVRVGLWLTKKRFVKYLAWWDGVDETDAACQFDTQFEDDEQYDTDDEPLAYLKGNRQDEDSKGSVTQRGQIRKALVSDDEGNGAARTQNGLWAE